MESNEGSFEKQNLLVFLGVVLLYFVSRLWGLTALPIFSDESIYIHLAERVADDPVHLFLFRMEGKQPLFFWLNALTLNVFSDPLVAGRTVCVLAGFASLTGIYLIGRHLYSSKQGLVAAWMYVFCPYTLFFDRLAVVDSLLCTFGVWLVYVSLRIAHAYGSSQDNQDDNSKVSSLNSSPITSGYLVLGLMMGLAFFTKATAILLMPVPIVVLFIYGCHKRKGFWQRLFLSCLVAGLLIAPIYLFGKKVGYFERTDLLQIPNRLALTPAELLAFPWAIWLRNADIVVEFFVTYLTMPMVLIIALGLGLGMRGKKGSVLALWAIIPTVSIIIVANGFFSRYFMISVPPLILLAAVGVFRLLEFLDIKLKAYFSSGHRKRQFAILTILLMVTLSDSFFLPGS